MKVTVDTRHDSLEEALATVHAAFGSSTTQPTPAAVATEPATPPAAMRQTSQASRIAQGDGRKARNQALSRKEVSCHERPRPRLSHTAPSASSKNPGKRAPATKASARNGTKATSSMTPTSNIAPPGQADTIRAWAKAQGMKVKQAGRLPAAVIQAYQESPDH